MPSSGRNIDVALLLREVDDHSLSRIRQAFKTVHYFPDDSSTPSSEILAEVQTAFMGWKGFPSKSIPSLHPLKSLLHVQLFSAGVEKALACPAIKEALEEGEGKLKFAITTASGIGVRNLASWAVMQVLAHYFRLPMLILKARNEGKWAGRDEIRQPDGSPYVARDLHDKTVGLLGYGHIGRETARLLQPFGPTIIAANTDGKRKADDGYILPGTGDKDGSIPSDFYSTRSPSSLSTFFKRSDVVIASLPSTPETRGLLDEKLLGLLPTGAVFVNVGRGDLVSSDALLAALSRNPTLSLSLDVSSPEPLPPSHPLLLHERCVVTPHVAGDGEGEAEEAVVVWLENVRRIREGERLVNEVDVGKGY